MQRIATHTIWHLVVTKCSEETIKLFLSSGVDVHIQNTYGDNVVHCMILAAAFQPELEDSLIERYTFLMHNIKKEDKFKLLLGKNKEKT